MSVMFFLVKNDMMFTITVDCSLFFFFSPYSWTFLLYLECNIQLCIKQTKTKLLVEGLQRAGCNYETVINHITL